MGFTNETGITTGISLHFDETEASYAESKVMRSISDKSFTVDMLVKPTDPNAAATFFNYDTKDGRAFALVRRRTIAWLLPLAANSSIRIRCPNG